MRVSPRLRLVSLMKVFCLELTAFQPAVNTRLSLLCPWAVPTGSVFPDHSSFPTGCADRQCFPSRQHFPDGQSRPAVFSQPTVLSRRAVFSQPTALYRVAVFKTSLICVHKHCVAVNTRYSYYTVEVNWISLLKEYADSKGCQVVYTVATTGLTRRPMHAVTAYFDGDIDRTAVEIGTTIKKARRQASKTCMPCYSKKLIMSIQLRVRKADAYRILSEKRTKILRRKRTKKTKILRKRRPKISRTTLDNCRYKLYLIFTH